MVQYNIVLHTSLQEVRQNTNQRLNPPIPRPDGWAMGCFLWIFWRKFTALLWHCTVYTILQWLRKNINQEFVLTKDTTYVFCEGFEKICHMISHCIMRALHCICIQQKSSYRALFHWTVNSTFEFRCTKIKGQITYHLLLYTHVIVSYGILQ